jgi:GTP-binding protein
MDTDSQDTFMVFGRGILHLSILIETMRREGYELQVGQPRVIIKEIDGKKCEPVEILTIDVPEEYSGKAIEQVTLRKGELQIMEPKGDLIHLEFEIPSKALMGLRTALMNATAGEAVVTHRFESYQPIKGNVPERQNGSLIALETGTAIAYALDKLQDRGRFFIAPGEEIYLGQVVGQHSRDNDLVVNLTKTKKLSNVRASGTDDKVQLAPPIRFSLEENLEYIQEDEYVEITPKSMRLRKILLDENDRKRASR